MSAYLYILRFKNSGKFYIGSTKDLARRISQHKKGHTPSTNRLGDFEVAFTQKIASIEKARWAERKIKSWKRKNFIEKIIKDSKADFVGV